MTGYQGRLHQSELYMECIIIVHVEQCSHSVKKV